MKTQFDPAPFVDGSTLNWNTARFTLPDVGDYAGGAVDLLGGDFAAAAAQFDPAVTAYAALTDEDELHAEVDVANHPNMSIAMDATIRKKDDCPDVVGVGTEAVLFGKGRWHPDTLDPRFRRLYAKRLSIAHDKHQVWGDGSVYPEQMRAWNHVTSERAEINRTLTLGKGGEGSYNSSLCLDRTRLAQMLLTTIGDDQAGIRKLLAQSIEVDGGWHPDTVWDMLTLGLAYASWGDEAFGSGVEIDFWSGENFEDHENYQITLEQGKLKIAEYDSDTGEFKRDLPSREKLTIHVKDDGRPSFSVRSLRNYPRPGMTPDPAFVLERSINGATHPIEDSLYMSVEFDRPQARHQSGWGRYAGAVLPVIDQITTEIENDQPGD